MIVTKWKLNLTLIVIKFEKFVCKIVKREADSVRLLTFES